jgi:4-hydroxy-tetrahydrodipicolinate synthase
MGTPFNEDESVDYRALEALVEWYLQRGVRGLFAVCQSSEMFHLSLRERVAVAARVVEQCDGRCGVIASGHVSDRFDDQTVEILAMAETGIDAVVLVSNRFAKAEEDDSVWIEALEALLKRLPSELPLGMYECPYPYKRLLSDRTFAAMRDSGRFRFLKDTCCDLGTIERRAEAAAGSELELFNANSATLLHSLQRGYAGYSGVMANFHPELYVHLVDRCSAGGDGLEELQEFLTLSALYELKGYPANAKYAISLEGVQITPECRAVDASVVLDELRRSETEQMMRYSKRLAGRLGVRG